MTTTARYKVIGMTCEHCVHAVSDGMAALAGVADVAVELSAGGVSTVRVSSSQPLAHADVARVIDEAGYQLA